MIATLPMYDWPEVHAATDKIWAAMCKGLHNEHFCPPYRLTRDRPVEEIWTAPDLLVAETCSWPLATTLEGKVRYLATRLHDVPGCAAGLYRSAIIARRDDRRFARKDCPVPSTPNADIDLPNMALSVARNGQSSLSGWVALASDVRGASFKPIETGAHRASLCAVAQCHADLAAIDAVSWDLALHHEKAMTDRLAVIGWTAQRPALPLITARHVSDDDLIRMRHAISSVVPVVIHDDPLKGLRDLQL